MDIYFELPTGKLYDEAVDALKTSLKPYGFGVLWEMNFKDKLREKDFEFDIDFKVLEVCNPAKAHEVLSSDISAGYFLPCKMAVYSKDGQIYIGMLKPTSLIELHGNKDLEEVAEEVEHDLIAAITEAVQQEEISGGQEIYTNLLCTIIEGDTH